MGLSLPKSNLIFLKKCLDKWVHFNANYEIIIDAGKTVGTKGENLVKIVISSDGGMLSAYPIK